MLHIPSRVAALPPSLVAFRPFQDTNSAIAYIQRAILEQKKVFNNLFTCFFCVINLCLHFYYQSQSVNNWWQRYWSLSAIIILLACLQSYMIIYLTKDKKAFVYKFFRMRKFFQYEIPKPIYSLFDEEVVRSNDLRLLLEIATRSSLRMYTDPKNGNLHFICKQRGANCYDIQAQRHPLLHSYYYFTYSYMDRKHMGNCHQINEAFSYLQIYNLMKLKKRLIEEFMVELKVQKHSPSIILNTLSEGSDQYFFEKYINGNLEFKRKLRKRFDNIVNIDIKKIGEKQQSEQAKQEQQGKDNQLGTKDKQKQMLAKEKESRRARQTQVLKEQTKISASQQNKAAKPGKIIKKSQKKQKSRPKRIKNIQPAVIGNDQDQSPPLIIEEQLLPEIKVLNEQAEYTWSSSESDQEPAAFEASIINTLNTEDYFKSLRNSLLNKSLERQSLTFSLFSSEPGINNKENK